VILNHTHGVIQFRCQHPACVAACARYVKRWKYERSHGRFRILDAHDVLLHVQTLRGAGWSLRAIGAEAGLSATTLSRICRAQKGVNRRTAERVLAIDPRALPKRGSTPDAEPFVPKVGTVRRIQALMAIGYSHAYLSGLGIHSRCLIHQSGQWVTRTTHDKVAATYRQLSSRPGPSIRAARDAAKHGYVSPAYWNDIDRDEAPDVIDLDAAALDDIDEAVVLRLLGGQLVPTTTAERIEIVARWPTTGRPLADLERLTGWKVERYHRTDTPDAA
jgi:AraC-like DNA-binding protein